MESVIFEILPPPSTWSDEKISKWCLDVSNLLKKEGLLTITIPEIIQESRVGERNVEFIPKIDNMHFASMLKQHYRSLVVIPNKICVKLTKYQLSEWIEHVYSKGIRHVVLVGGERSDTNYPGYSVEEATLYVKKHFPEMKVGGITIFTRKGEAKRLLRKIEAGMDFFFSQIIFEASNMKHIVLSLLKLCQKEGFNMPQIYLSLALASKVSDVEFMKWLGVEFPSAVLSYLEEEQEESVENCSMEVVDMLLDEIFAFMEKDKINLGFNIEHVMYTNLHLSEKLFKDIKKRVANK